EALDKIGRLLGLGYPAAPVMEELAKSGDSTLYPFPLPLTARHDANLSFSGLKTHAHHLITSLQQDHQLTRQDICNLAASAQAGVFRHLTYKLDRLLQPHPETASFTHLFLGGGVAANNYLRILLRQLGKKHHYTLHVPVSKRLCGDNAAMIALVAALKARAQLFASLDTVDRQPNLQLSSWDANK
ncbi:hypothetical protein IJI99_02490, partial [bacterium]|nr:hypothetical protein [bacterium]